MTFPPFPPPSADTLPAKPTDDDRLGWVGAFCLALRDAPLSPEDLIAARKSLGCAGEELLALAATFRVDVDLGEVFDHQ